MQRHLLSVHYFFSILVLNTTRCLFSILNRFCWKRKRFANLCNHCHGLFALSVEDVTLNLIKALSIKPLAPHVRAPLDDFTTLLHGEKNEWRDPCLIGCPISRRETMPFNFLSSKALPFLVAFASPSSHFFALKCQTFTRPTRSTSSLTSVNCALCVVRYSFLTIQKFHLSRITLVGCIQSFYFFSSHSLIACHSVYSFHSWHWLFRANCDLRSPPDTSRISLYIIAHRENRGKWLKTQRRQMGAKHCLPSPRAVFIAKNQNTTLQ